MDNNNNIFNQFDLPEGYFKGSKAGILNKIEWTQEHEAYPILAGLKGKSGFVVPENYFSAKAAELELLDLPVLAAHQKQNGFEVPSNYFENSISSLQDKINEIDELNAYPLLNAQSKTHAFITKPAYFEENKKKLLTIATEKTGAKILFLGRKTVWYAAAAVLTITIGLWIYNSFFIEQELINGDCNTLACIEKRELLKFKLENFDSDELLDMVNSDKLKLNLEKKEKTDTLKTNDSIDAELLDMME